MPDATLDRINWRLLAQWLAVAAGAAASAWRNWGAA